MNRIVVVLALLLAAVTAPATAQLGGRITVQPYVGYGFYGSLPDDGARLESTLSYGGRLAYQMSDQFALFANGQRSKPKTGQIIETEVTVDHWSAGVEFSYVPRGGAEGMLPILLEAGLGQARYEWEGLGDLKEDDLAVNLGLASALRMTPNFSIRYGVNDYISNYNSRGVTNQIFAQVGAELRF